MAAHPFRWSLGMSDIKYAQHAHGKVVKRNFYLKIANNAIIHIEKTPY